MTRELLPRIKEEMHRASLILQIPEQSLMALWLTAEERRQESDPADIEEAARHALWARGDRVNGWQPGSFTESLMITWDRADTMNKVRLRVAFPLLTHAFELGRNGGDEAIMAWGGIGGYGRGRS